MGEVTGSLQSARTTFVERNSCSKCSWERISMTDMIGREEEQEN
jgi:hypothetical protein